MLHINSTAKTSIAKISMASPIDINVPSRALLDAETKGSFVRWLANLNIKRNVTSMFINRYLPYSFLNECVRPRTGGSVGWASGGHAGGRGFEARPDQPS